MDRQDGRPLAKIAGGFPHEGRIEVAESSSSIDIIYLYSGKKVNCLLNFVD